MFENMSTSNSGLRVTQKNSSGSNEYKRKDSGKCRPLSVVPLGRTENIAPMNSSKASQLGTGKRRTRGERKSSMRKMTDSAQKEDRPLKEKENASPQKIDLKGTLMQIQGMIDKLHVAKQRQRHNPEQAEIDRIMG